MTTQIIQIHLSDGTSKNVRVDSFTTVQRIVNVVLDGLGMDRLSFGHFALRLATFSGGLGSIAAETQWLHPSLRMPEIAHRYISPLTSGLQMRFELRIRFIPRGLHEMYQTQMAAFLYLYDQLVTDYIQHISWKIDTDKAFYMAALILRKRFPTLTGQNVEKKLDFGLIDEEGGLLRYLPESIVVTTKKKLLHKQVVSALREVLHLSELESVFKFMKQLMFLARFDTEIFRVSFGTSWERPVELYIGQYFGIAYKNENTKEPVGLADLRNVIDVSIRRMNANSEQCIIRIKISGNTIPMIITTSTINMAESLAHLIDGYQMILSQQRSVWINYDLKNQPETEISNKSVEQRKKSETLSPLVGRKFVVPASDLNSQNNVESASLMHSMHIDPGSVRLEELLGSGQYGNVYRGFYTKNGKKSQVAVKVCKSDFDAQDANKFLMEEAYIMSQFHHKHIIQLVGISCANSIVWVVLELAACGELRQYLKREQQSIGLPVQLLFSKQLSDAVSYLTKHSFVHRDIAGRNVLVSNPKCVKLSDFGMCRLLNDDLIYTSTSTKLPLKWMPVESLNYRRFTKESDVYMLGVCIWEILSYGDKPWQDTRNHEVVTKLERGEVLKRPENCPIAVYELLKEMWHLDPKQRIEVFDVYVALKDFLLQIDQRMPYEDLLLYKTPKTPVNKVPQVLRIDSMDVELSILQQTIEQQRAQSIEDEKWLQEQEQIGFPSEEVGTRPSNENLGPRGIKPANQLELDRENDQLFMAISDVSDSIYEFTQSCSPLATTDFVNFIEKILYQLEHLNAISAPHFELLDFPYRKKVEFTQKLLNTNANNLRQTIKGLDESDLSTIENYHREALRICNVLIIHSKQFLDSIDLARLSSGTASLKKS